MAPTKQKTVKKPSSNPSFTDKCKKLVEKYSNLNYIKKLIFDPHYITPTCYLLFIFEIFLNISIIQRVKYTEIDWKAYMQEVEGFLNGTLDYSLLKGDTGPLVYPAGFVYFYSILYYITDQGKNIYLAQYIFLTFYLIQTALTYRIFIKTSKIPAYALIITTLTSYRIHSIFVLRLFNDPIAVILFYISLNCFISNRWIFGSIFYSLAVSVKMNILLYSPALLIAYLTNLSYSKTVLNLFICGLIQLILGLPFLLNNPISYLRNSFDIGRIFEHKWTVNYRFLPRDLFENRYFHLFLLLLHVTLLLVFVPLFKRYFTSYSKLFEVTQQIKPQLIKERNKNKLNKKEQQFLDQFEEQLKQKMKKSDDNDEMIEEMKLEDKMNKITQLFVLPFFLSNLIGIICARSLHYQFYSWYFHSLIYLVFCTNYNKWLMFLILSLLEYCWNCYPSTVLSSCLLHLCHLVLLFGIYRTTKS